MTMHAPCCLCHAVQGSTQLRALALIGTIAACIGLVTSDVGSVKVTQAGCACLDNWQDSQGNTQVGCVNPNGDPKVSMLHWSS